MTGSNTTDAHAAGANENAGKAILIGGLAASVPAIAAIFFTLQLPAVINGETLRISVDWVSSLGVNLSFRLDGLSMIFALLISAIGAVVAITTLSTIMAAMSMGGFPPFLGFVGKELKYE